MLRLVYRYDGLEGPDLLVEDVSLEETKDLIFILMEQGKNFLLCFEKDEDEVILGAALFGEREVGQLGSFIRTELDKIIEKRE